MSVPDFEVWGMSNRQRPGKITYGVPGADDVGTRTSNVRSMGTDTPRSLSVMVNAIAEAANKNGEKYMIALIYGIVFDWGI
jgi:hypothetical protein